MTFLTLNGVKLHVLTMTEAVKVGLNLLEQPGTHRCYTPNPKLLTFAAKDKALRRTLNRADLSLADGVGVSLAARLTGQGKLPRCPGADYALLLAKAAGRRQKRIFLLGGTPGVAQEAGKALLAQCPGLILAGTADGYFTDPRTTAAKIRETAADLVFVCLGCPRQEQWIDGYGADTGARLLLGLGGTLDVLAGQVHRAPLLWRRFGIEWLWRGLCQPWRMLEWWRLPVFLCQALLWTQEKDPCDRETNHS